MVSITIEGIKLEGDSAYIANIIKAVIPYTTYLTEMRSTLGEVRYKNLISSLLKMLLDPNLKPPFTVSGNLSSFFVEKKAMDSFTEFLTDQETVKKVEGEEALTEAQAKTIAGTSIKIVPTKINGVVVLGQPEFIDSVKKANADMIADGKGPILINESYRSYKQQKVYSDKWLAYQAGTGPYANNAALPGTSNHEFGLAIDCNNGPAAQKYLNRYGLKSNAQSSKGHIDPRTGKLVKGERWHFSPSGF